MLVYGFNFDGTLVQNFTATPLPGVPAALARLPSNAKIFVATNQAGPVFRVVTGEPRYPLARDVARIIHAALAALRFRPDLVLVCCAASEARRGPPWSVCARSWPTIYAGALANSKRACWRTRCAASRIRG